MIALTYKLQTEMHFVFIAAMLGHVLTSPFALIVILFIYLFIYYFVETQFFNPFPQH
jgi:hypothetical protein